MKNSTGNIQKPHRLWECLCGQGQCYEWSDGTTDCGWDYKKILKKEGWYSSGFSMDSEGVQYAVMQFVAPAEYDKAGNRLPPPGEGLWYHRAGESVGDAVVHY